jgi:hypothetical protein
VRRKRIGLFVTSIAIAAAFVSWFVRTESGPCGRLDSSSECVSHVALDVAATGLDPKTVNTNLRSFDIASGGKVALVGLTGGTKNRSRSVLAMFDTGTGKLIRVLRDVTGGGYARGQPATAIGEVAFSADGLLAASWALARPDHFSVEQSLLVQTTADGSTVSTLKEPKNQTTHLTAP